MLSRGNEVANRTNFVAVHESGIDAVAYGFLRKVPSVSERPHRSLSRIVY